MKKPNISIVIPAHNEEKNLPLLLDDIAKQTQLKYKIDAVIVISDASTDATASIAQSFKKLPIKLIELKKQSGKANAINAVFSKVSTDILVQLDADIRITASNSIEELIKPIVHNNKDLTSAKVVEHKPINMFQSALKTSMDFKRSIFEKYKNGNNIFTCHGRARAFSKKLYQQLRMPVSAGEDAYSYLYCISHKFGYQYVSDALVYYSLPSHFSDHMLQSTRYFQHDFQLNNFFDAETLHAEYTLPTRSIIASATQFFIKSPLNMMLYLVFVIACRLATPFQKKRLHIWDVAKSSK